MLLKLAWRNIWRNWRRSILTILAVFFAALLSIVSRSMQLGTYEENIKTTVEMFTGYVQIQEIGFQENPSINKSFRIDENLNNILSNDQNVLSYAKRIIGNGLISYRQNTFGIVLFGISPEEELRTSKLKDRVRKGKFLQKGENGQIIIGEKLLNNLNAQLGDTIVLLTSGADGTMGNMKFVISGSFSLGSPEMDASTAFINLEAADEILSMRGKINVLALKLNSVAAIQSTVDNFNKSNKDTTLKAMGWEEILPELKQSIDLDDVSNLIFLFLLVVVVAFGILNTVLMSITERFREFGILLAIGTNHSKLVIIVFLEICFLILIGIILGNLVSHAINYYYYLNPIFFDGNFADIYEQYGFIPALYFSLDPWLYFDMSIRIIIISLLTFIYPAYRINKLEALKGIRYT